MQYTFPVLESCKPLKSEFNKLKEIKISSKEFTLGRGLNSSIVIPSLYISRSHCTIKIHKDAWVIEDHSSCGIQINGIKVGKGCTRNLSNDDIITLEPTEEFKYKFIWDDDCPPLSKKIKLEVSKNDFNLNNVKEKFEESQNYEIRHIEDKINKQKQIQETNLLLKNQLYKSMNRKLEQLENNYSLQIESLKGESIEVEKQKSLLLAKHNVQVSAIKQEMDSKINDLMNQIKKHSAIESELMVENNSLKEKLLKEREEFLSELNRESSSKQDLLEKLQDKIKEQEELRLKEKMELEQMLQNELEQLRLAKEKELNEVAEQQRLREEAIMQEHNKIKETLQKQIEITEKQRQEAEQQLNNQKEQMKKLTNEDKAKMDQLIQEREEIQKLLLTAKEDAKKSVEELKMRVEEREVELATLAAERIQMQSEQSGQVITSLQEQLEKVKSQLKEKLLENGGEQIKDRDSPGTSKENALAEVGEIMESELQCSICAELFVSATTLNCSHTFCKYCIAMWKKKKKDCPICRAPIISECRSIVLDSFIEKMVQNLTDEMKNKRQAMLKSREELELKVERRPSTGSSRRRSASESDWSETESESEAGSAADSHDDADAWPWDPPDDYDYPFAFNFGFRDYHRYSSDSDSGSDSDSNPSTGSNQPAGTNAPSRGNSNRRGRRVVPGAAGAYYGGYGRCFRCGARGHWAPGCPL